MPWTPASRPSRKEIGRSALVESFSSRPEIASRMLAASSTLRAKVGAMHLPLGLFVQAFLDAGFRIERFEEPGERDYPVPIGLRAVR